MSKTPCSDSQCSEITGKILDKSNWSIGQIQPVKQKVSTSITVKIMIKSLVSMSLVCKERRVQLPRASGFCNWASEFC